MSHGNKKDYTGLKYNRLTALCEVRRDREGRFIWQWLCDCGTVKNIVAKFVSSGSIKSCGCATAEMIVRNRVTGFGRGMWLGKDRCPKV